MRFYRSGRWGFALVWGLRASVFPYAMALAAPNAILAYIIGEFVEDHVGDKDQDAAKYAQSIWVGFTSVLFFVLYFRSNVAYDRWWEGGTLLQQTRGEWFNAYSSLIAFSSTDPKRADEVEKYHHMLARLMSLLMCCALQQVSPDRNRTLEVIDPTGVEPQHLQFLKESSDKVEVILQWIQRSTIINMGTGILQAPPPVMSRAFQEISRGIVNLQNARKIAEFPFPYPYAQTSIVMLLIHWMMMPVLSSMLLPKVFSACTCFVVIFFLWCINYIALQLEQPFGSDANDLPMFQMQQDWNKSVGTLLIKRANCPPNFAFDPHLHRQLQISMSDGSTETAHRMTLPTGIYAMDGVHSRGEPITEAKNSLPPISMNASIGPKGRVSRSGSNVDDQPKSESPESNPPKGSDAKESGGGPSTDIPVRSPTDSNVPEELYEGVKLSTPFASPAKYNRPGDAIMPIGNSSEMTATGRTGGGGGGGGGSGGGGGGVGYGGGSARANGETIGAADKRWHSLDLHSTVVRVDTISGSLSASRQRLGASHGDSHSDSHSDSPGDNAHRRGGWDGGLRSNYPHFTDTETHDQARPLATTAATHTAAPSVL